MSKSSEALLWYSLILILILVAIPFSFVFIINWEDWIFGIKLDGWPAGIALLAKAVTAFTLAVLLIWFPKYKRGLSLLTIAYFGFLLVDSATTIQKNTAGKESFSILLLLFFLVPVLYLIVHILASRMDKGRQNTGAIVPATDVSIPEREVKKPSADPVVLFVGVIVALIFTWVIPIPFVFSFPAPNLPLLADLDVPPARDTLLTRISQNGTVEWQSVLPGYSLDLVVVKTLPGCGSTVRTGFPGNAALPCGL